MSNTSGSLHRSTAFRNGARRAGTGMVEDYYGDDSVIERGEYFSSIRVRFPNDDVPPESLNGEVICYKAGDTMPELPYNQDKVGD